jgi:hypothetical protein
MKGLSRPTLRSLFFLIFGLLLLPALTFSLIGYFRADAQGQDLGQLRIEIDAINQELSESVTAPFYMSPRSFDPCDSATLDMVSHPDNWRIENNPSENWRFVCEWAYYKNGVLVAKDSWNDYDRKLGKREYFRDELELIGKDTFFVLDDQKRVKCIKQREYEEFQVVECYAESGTLVSIDPIDSVFSPLPPMLYWFAYR